MEPITLYTTKTCGYCYRLKWRLKHKGIPYEEIDVNKHPEYNARILQATGGFRTVPTVEVGEKLLVNPSLAEIEAALGAFSTT